MLFQINPSFTKKNQLKLDLSKNILDENFKLCFSLVYSIKSIEGAEIIKQIGRYYELEIKSNIILITLQKTRLGTYNMSCGPEGAFLINNKNDFVNIKINKLQFENEIFKTRYENKTTDKIIPIIPEPLTYSFNNKFIELEDRNFKVKEEEIIQNTFEILSNLDITFSNSNGFPIIFKQTNYIIDEYTLEILEDRIEIFYNNYGGQLYSIITLIQIVDYYKNRLPLVKIHDKPKYAWRGMHLDCARQFYSINEIKKILDYMVLFKLNRFHWHLTDNEAWRIEIKSYPNLSQLGSYRGYNMKIPPFYGSGYYKYGGYYTHEDVKNLILYAKKLNIEIMPEIDLPAHSWALLQIIPDLREQKSNTISDDVGSYKNNTINPALKETKKFLELMLEEICNIFTFDTIHVGLDERPKNSWFGSSLIDKSMKENNLKSQAEYQDYYMNYLIDIIKSKNKNTAAWNEAAVTPHIDHDVGGSAGNLDKSCLIFAWENKNVAKEVTDNEFNTILCPGEKTYFDMAYNNSTDERGLCWASTIEVKDIFNWDPEENIENKKLIKGIQAQLWSETINNKLHLDKMINPRLATLSEIAWKGKAHRNWESFRTVLLNTCKMLKNFGWNYHLF